MRRQPYAVALVAAAACFLAGCAQADARRTASSAANPAVKPVDVLSAAFSYADSWWTERGSVPPCPGAAQISMTVTVPDGEHVGFGYYGSCVVEIQGVWWTTASRVIRTANLRGRRAMLAQLCLLAIHERGHNLGYRHMSTGVMRAQLDVMPGGCVVWAAKMAPRR